MQKIETWNFKLIAPPGSTATKTMVDMRNGIVCHNPTYGIDCYINYIELLNGMKERWKSFGYLDAGMMPLAMGPSFMQGELVERWLEIAQKIGLRVYLLPPVTMLYIDTRMQHKDIWAFKEDVARCFGKNPESLSLVDLLRMVE